MNILSTTNLKEFIICKLDQVLLFSKYTDIPIHDINLCLSNKNKKAINRLRTDEHPSVGFTWHFDRKLNEYKIKMYDFADSYWRGDLFEIVGKVLQLNSNNNLDFIKICEHIIQNGSNDAPVIYTTQLPKTKKEHTLTTFGITFRDFTKLDLSYWKETNLTKEDLIKNHVYAVDTYWNTNDGKILYRYNPKDVCYAYLLDNIKEHLIWKFYFINRGRNGDKRSRFITNNIYPLEALNELHNADILVITKSRADKLLLVKLLDEIKVCNLYFLQGNYTICVTNFATETAKLTKALVDSLKQNYRYICINPDFDAEGMRCAQYHWKTHKIPAYMLTNGRGGTKNYGAKDIRDYFKAFGKKKTIELLNTLVNNIVAKSK